MATIPADARLLGFTLTTQYTQMLLPVSTAGLIESFSEAQELAEASLYDGGIEWVHVLAQYERDGKFGVIKFSDFLCEFCDEFPFGRMLSEAPA